MGAKKDNLDKQVELTPLQRILRTIGLFKDNAISPDVVLEAAEKLTVESADPKNADVIVHIDNGIERLAGIVVQGSEGFKANFIDALNRGEQKAQETGGIVTPQVATVIKKLNLAAA